MGTAGFAMGCWRDAEPMMMCATVVAILVFCTSVLMVQAPYRTIVPLLSVAPYEDWNLLKFCKALGVEDEAENAWERREPQDKESVEPKRCEKPKARLGDGFVQKQRRPVCSFASFGFLWRRSRIVEAGGCLNVFRC